MARRKKPCRLCQRVETWATYCRGCAITFRAVKTRGADPAACKTAVTRQERAALAPDHSWWAGPPETFRERFNAQLPRMLKASDSSAVNYTPKFMGEV